MGNKPSKRSSFLCCPCRFEKRTRRSSSTSIDEKQIEKFDRLSTNEEETTPLKKNDEQLEKPTNSSVQNRRSVSLHNVVLPSFPSPKKIVQSKPPLPNTKSKLAPVARRSFRTNLQQTKRTYYSQSIEDLEKSIQGASSIDQWIDSLPVVGTPSLNRNKTVIPLRSVSSAQKIKRSFTVGDDSEQKTLNQTYHQEIDGSNEVQRSIVDSDLSKFLTRPLIRLAKEIDLDLNLTDFRTRLSKSKIKEKFINHFTSNAVIYPPPVVESTLVNDLLVYNHTPSEYFLPIVSSNEHSNYKLSEQIRSKSYFYPSTLGKIEIRDEEYEKQTKELDRTHFVITLETKSKLDNEESIQRTNKSSVDFNANGLLSLDETLNCGFIRVDSENSSKLWRPFFHRSNEENLFYLSSNLVQQWFQTLILVNQTCAIARRFLKGDGSHLTCLLKEPTTKQSLNNDDNHDLTFAALRLPPCMYIDPIATDLVQQENVQSIDVFSSNFLSDNTKTSNDSIHIDYELYSFAFILNRWPKTLLEQFHRRPNRCWPSNYHMNILVKKSLLLVPTGNEHQWRIEFDLVEQSLFELMPQTTLCFYAFAQRILGQTDNVRTIVKHCFLNYAEQHGLPFSSISQPGKETFVDGLMSFSKEIRRQLDQQSIRHYFNPKINLFSTIEKVDQWIEHLEHCSKQDYSSDPALSSLVSNRPIVIEFLFHFIDQLYQTFHLKRSQFHLNENILLELHQQVCEKFSNDTNNNNSASLQKVINDLLNNTELLEHIQMSLAYQFETNAELVHNSLNQVRKADSSLIFHYTWTIYIQYLHTYYNTLWNV